MVEKEYRLVGRFSKTYLSTVIKGYTFESRVRPKGF